MTDSPFSRPSAPARSEDDPDAGMIEAESRRKLPDPLDMNTWKWFARASRYASHITDHETVEMWRIAMAVLGLGRRRDLYGLSHIEQMPDDTERGWWMPWYKIGKRAIDAADADKKANEGTIIHALSDRLDRGEITLGQVPPEWRPHLRAYARLHERYGLSVSQDLLETIIVTKALHNGVCGRLDRGRPAPDGSIVIDDLKTGQNVPLGLDEIAIQLAIYANAQWKYDPKTKLYTKMPDNVRKDFATITHVPLRDPKLSEIVPIDIAWGWEAAKIVAWVLGYRNRAKRKHNGLRLPLAVLEQLKDDVVGKILTEINGAGTLEELADVWDRWHAHSSWSDELEKHAHERAGELGTG